MGEKNVLLEKNFIFKIFEIRSVFKKEVFKLHISSILREISYEGSESRR